MKNIINKAPFALGLIAATVSTVSMAAVPTSGDYVNDKQNTWVQDRVGDRIGTVNMIMCIMSSLRGDAKVNQGAYVALIDKNKCEGRGKSSGSTSNSAGASNATDYMSAVVTSSQESETSPLIIKAWMAEEEEDNGTTHKATISVYIEATAGKSEANPNGLFSMYFCGTPENTSGCAFHGALRSDANGLRFFEDETQSGGSTTNLRLLTAGSDTGSGQVHGTSQNQAFDYRFAYDTSHFLRDDGSAGVCFDRSQANAETSTWRYGTYNADGSRLSVDNPGFPVKYVTSAQTYFGFWSFWGLWLPQSAMDTFGTGNEGVLTRHVGSTDQVLTVQKKGGKLWKLTSHADALDHFKNVPMMFWAQNNIGSGPNQLQQGHNYELQWTNSGLFAINEQMCSQDGCSPSPLASPVQVLASTIRGLGVQTLPIFFPSGGGSGAIKVPASGEFVGSTNGSVSYRTRDVVNPADVNAPTELHCLSMCPKSGTDLTTLVNGQIDPFFQQSGWGQVAVGNETVYTVTSGMLRGTGGSSGDVDASGIAKSAMGSNQYGITTGSMIDTAQLASVRCDSNGTQNDTGANICPGLVEQAAVVYQWETGPNQWNQYFGASLNSTPLIIDPPKTLSFTASSSSPANIHANSTNLAKYNGNTLQLQFSGFGELQGVPGHCVNPDTNAEAPCGQDIRWVPAFDIVDGSTVTEGSTNYFIKYLEREMRLSQAPGACSALTLPVSATLDVSSIYDLDPVATIGTKPTPASPKAAVIDGSVQ
jgi:hypothetical protein